MPTTGKPGQRNLPPPANARALEIEHPQDSWPVFGGESGVTLRLPATYFEVSEPHGQALRRVVKMPVYSRQRKRHSLLLIQEVLEHLVVGPAARDSPARGSVLEEALRFLNQRLSRPDVQSAWI